MNMEGNNMKKGQKRGREAPGIRVEVDRSLSGLALSTLTGEDFLE